MFRVVAALAVAALAAGCMQAPSTPMHDRILLDEPHTHLLVEVDAFGQEPCPEALSSLLAHLRWVTTKDVQLVVERHGPTLHEVHGNDGLHALAAGTRSATDGLPAGLTVRLHVLFVDGTAAGSGHAAGRTFADDGLIAIFPDQYADAHRLRGGDARCEVERAVVLHELGHTLGLVNRGVPMLSDREADDHAGHSTNPQSVMYPTIRIGPGGLVVHPVPSGFDADDLRDLAAYQVSRSGP